MTATEASSIKSEWYKLSLDIFSLLDLADCNILNFKTSNTGGIDGSLV